MTIEQCRFLLGKTDSWHFRRLFDLRQLKQMNAKKSSSRNWHFFFIFRLEFRLSRELKKINSKWRRHIRRQRRIRRIEISSTVEKHFAIIGKMSWPVGCLHAEAIHWIVLPARCIRKKKLLCHRQRESYVIHSVPDHRTCEPASLQLTALFLIYALAKKTKVEFSARVEMKNGKAVRRPNYSV